MRAAADVGQAAGPGRPCAPSGKERFGNRLGDSVGAGRKADLLQVAPFFISTNEVVPFFVVTWPPNLSSSDSVKGISGPHLDEKLAPHIIDKHKSVPRPRADERARGRMGLFAFSRGYYSPNGRCGRDHL